MNLAARLLRQLFYQRKLSPHFYIILSLSKNTAHSFNKLIHLAAQFFHQLHTQNKLHPHSYIILPDLTAHLLHYFTPLNK